MRVLKQSTAANVMVFMTDSADHVTGKASLTLTITASKDGGAFASVTPTVTDRGSGWYNLALTTAHTDTLGDLAIHITSTGADPSDLSARIVAVDFADAVRFGLSALPTTGPPAAYLGDFTPGVTIDVKFATMLLTLAATPAISVYKNNGTTESTTGVTLTVDFDSRTGLHHVRIDTSADTTFYAGGAEFMVVVTAGTVGGTSAVGTVIGQFSLHNRSQTESVYYGAVTGAATTTTLVDSGLTQADTGFWNGRVIIFLTGAIKWQATRITAFTPGTDTLTFGSVTTAPSAADKYVIV